MNARLELQNVSFAYPPEHTHVRFFGDVEDITFSLREGQPLSVVGCSGSGKTTLVRLISGFLLPGSGQILWNGRPVANPSPERGVVFQNNAMFPWLTVAENVEFGLKMQKMRSGERRRKVAEYLDLLNLGRYAAASLYKISDYNVLLRVSLARCLVCDPPLLILDDEPLGELDDAQRTQLQKLLLNIWEAKQHMMLTVTHDVDEALILSTEVLIMGGRPGRIIDRYQTSFAPRAAHEGIQQVRRTKEFSEMRQTILRHIVCGV